MKILKNIGFWGLLFLAFAGCQKEKSFEIPGGFAGNAAWEFKEAASQFKGPMDTAYIDTINGVKVLTLEGKSENAQEDIILQVLASDLKPGTYSSAQTLFAYSNAGGIIYENDILGGFSVTIDKIDTAGVSGTFTGKVFDANNVTKTVTDGKFSAKLSKKTPQTGTGQVLLWAAQGCAASSTGPINLRIDGQIKVITAFTATEPACGASGSATYSLPVGTHSWIAFCGTQDSITGTVTVIANGCVKVKVDFSKPPTNCKITKWLEYDASTGQKEWAYISTFGANINTLQKFEWFDSLANQYVAGPFNFAYSAGKIQIDPKQYFVTDISGRATEFQGHPDPAIDSAQSVVKYTYNAAGQLIKRTEADVAAPTVVLYQYDYTYTSGNLTKITVKDGTGVLLLAEILYEYDLAVTVKSFLSLFGGSYEITYFQQGINTGTPTNTAKLIKATTSIKVPALTNYVTTFDNYVIDPATNYVKSFDVKGDDCEALRLYSGYRYKLEYKCF